MFWLIKSVNAMAISNTARIILTTACNTRGSKKKSKKKKKRKGGKAKAGGSEGSAGAGAGACEDMHTKAKGGGTNGKTANVTEILDDW